MLTGGVNNNNKMISRKKILFGIQEQDAVEVTF